MGDLRQGRTARLVGRVGRAVLRHADAEASGAAQASGTAICNVSIATTSQWKNKASGERREETEWHRVVFYNRLAEIAGEYLKKGRSVSIKGRLKTRKWQDKETGADRYSTDIVADQMQMLGGREDDGGQHHGSSQQAAPPQRQDRPAAPAAPAGGLADMDDDIPFSALGVGRAWAVT
ncbi:single-stranded DNA-binding protein [Castellaniella ginsengisoli]|uniref:Single-stranded DNA-binding protein n=1 Tax=Castellaniella ginsengisoli TaxID=546114 RepID=A0AB39DC33_9BURK